MLIEKLPIPAKDNAKTHIKALNKNFDIPGALYGA